jgi:MoaA/NifB/PqqE/SkfB family radical SAM enzyme
MQTIQIELTELCNFNCNICYLERKLDSKITSDFANGLASLADNHGFSKIAITGGEPTIHPEFTKIYRAFREKGYIVSIYTNGSNLSDKIVETFKNQMPHIIEITLYGMTEEVYHKVTGKVGMLKRVMSNIEWLFNSGATLFLKFHLTKDTYHEAYIFQQFVKDRNIQHGFNAQIIPMLNGNMSPTKKRLSPEILKKLEVELDIPLSQTKGKPSECDAGKTLYITSQGLVRGCTILTKGEMLIDQDNPSDSFNKIQELFTDFHKRKSRNYCTAWINLESLENVKRFVDAI